MSKTNQKLKKKNPNKYETLSKFKRRMIKKTSNKLGKIYMQLILQKESLLNI